MQWIDSHQFLLLALVGMLLLSVVLARALKIVLGPKPTEPAKPANLTDEREAVVRAVLLQLQEGRVLQEVPEPIRPRIVNRWLQRIYLSVTMASEAVEIRRDQTALQERLERAMKADSPFDRITSVDHIIFMTTVENLTSEIRRLQSDKLNRWDVALVVFTILGLVFAVVGATLAAVKVIIELLE